MEYDLLCPKFTDLIVNLIKKKKSLPSGHRNHHRIIGLKEVDSIAQGMWRSQHQSSDPLAPQ